jgi:hypothetical protein
MLRAPLRLQLWLQKLPFLPRYSLILVIEKPNKRSGELVGIR